MKEKFTKFAFHTRNDSVTSPPRFIATERPRWDTFFDCLNYIPGSAGDQLHLAPPHKIDRCSGKHVVTMHQISIEKREIRRN